MVTGALERAGRAAQVSYNRAMIGGAPAHRFWYGWKMWSFALTFTWHA
jgi:hypothetical protein